MSVNDRSEIVPVGSLLCVLLSKLESDVDIEIPYDRVQLLEKKDYEDLVYRYDNRGGMSYGNLSPDFPLCEDYADLVRADVKRGAIRDGLACRPAFGVLEYTMTLKNADGQNTRHAINFAVTVDRQVLWYDPQMDRWIKEPEYLDSMDKFWL